MNETRFYTTSMWYLNTARKKNEEALNDYVKIIEKASIIIIIL